MSEVVGAMYVQGMQYDVRQSSVEMVRQEHIKYEASVRSVGVLYYLGAYFTFLGSCLLFAIGITEGHIDTIIVSSLFIVIGIVQGIVAWGLRRLCSWARIPTIILSFIDLFLFGFPIGTLVNGYIIYLVSCKKGVMVFSDEYKDIIEATPHIVYKTSKVVWIFLIILILMMLLAIIGAMFAGNS